MLQNKLGIGLIIAELSIATAVVLVAATIITYNKGRMDIDTGLDEEELIRVSVQSYGEQYQERADIGPVWLADKDYLKKMSGVVNVTQISPTPLQGGGSSDHRKPMDAPKEKSLRMPLYWVDQNAFDTLGLEIIEGRGFEPGDFLPIEMTSEPDDFTAHVIITKQFSDELFPGESAVGKQIQNSEGSYTETVVGIVDYMHTPYDNGKSGMEYRAHFSPFLSGSAGFTVYLVKAEKNAINDLIKTIPEKLEAQFPDRIVKADSFLETYKNGRMQNTIMVKMLSALLFLLVFVSAVGLYGLTSFRVAGRIKQIGTRRALGATKSDIARYILLENGIILFVSLLLGTTFALGLNGMALEVNGGQKLDATFIIIGWVSVILVGCLAALGPALKAAAIPPIQATREA